MMCAGAHSIFEVASLLLHYHGIPENLSDSFVSLSLELNVGVLLRSENEHFENVGGGG